ncbi:hypothetical protein EMWEY_00051230 [Eimeria maxima]|uniref:Uncharacterized protein n=1 Tax=Eimeria maxima TaxID=5804 RepID=U6M600_EIMMA|nr:hypothetical protein EMWEY_00051230 [Eimeria maxima]CDJ58498.1 hypothetical protein EMWEY_00051230 [Eimeria maxima]
MLQLCFGLTRLCSVKRLKQWTRETKVALQRMAAAVPVDALSYESSLSIDGSGALLLRLVTFGMVICWF